MININNTIIHNQYNQLYGRLYQRSIKSVLYPIRLLYTTIIKLKVIKSD